MLGLMTGKGLAVRLEEYPRRGDMDMGAAQLSSHKAFLLAAIAIGLSGTSCSNEGKQIEEITEAANNSERSGWVPPHDEKAPRSAAVVFVHGIFGTTRGTWTSTSGATFFDLIRKYPEVGDKIDVYAFGYTSEMFKGGSFTIQEAANKLALFLREQKVLEYDTIIMVGHSMGGLVIMTALSVQPEWSDRVPLVLMYGTPQEGSQLASIGKELLKNPALKQLVPSDPGAFVDSLEFAWTNLPADKRPELVCAYEKLPVYGFEVVSKSSGTRYCAGVSHAIENTNHITITKPNAVEDYAVRLLGSKLRDVLGTDRSPRIETLDFKVEAKKLVFEMRDPLTMRNTARLHNSGALRARIVVGKPTKDKLMITPAEYPRFIPAGKTEELSLEILARGEWVKEVEFELDMPGQPNQIVEVRIPDLQAWKDQAAAIQNQIRSDLSEALADPEIRARVMALPHDQQPQFVVELAERTLRRLGVGATPGSRWVYVAEAMTSESWSTYAIHALERARAASPALADSAAVQSLSDAVAIKTGTEPVFRFPSDMPLLPPVQPGNYLINQETWQIGTANLAEVRDLTRNMQSIPGLRQAGLLLEGNALLKAGQNKNAEKIYRRALDLNNTPEAEMKWRTARDETPPLLMNSGG